MSSQNETIDIRPLRADDYAGWRLLWTAYLEFYESSVAEEVYETTFARLIGDDRQDFSGFVAEQKGELLGLVHYLFHRHCWRIENSCYLQDLFVSPAARGRGVGADLIKAVYQAADDQGSPNVYWLTQDFNVNARKLYDQIGEQMPFIKYQRP